MWPSLRSWLETLGLLRIIEEARCTPEATADPDEASGDWPEFDGGLDSIPVGRKEMIEVYGNPSVAYTSKGKVQVSRKWEYANLSTVPADLIPGYHRRIYMHDKVEPYFREAMRRSVIACPDYVFERIGCFSPRHMRRNKSRPLSDHTWAIAFDINASKNRSLVRKPGGPLPFDPGWEDLSDMPWGVVDAWESVGFEWGGRWGNGPRGGYVDPMHFSLRKVR